MKNKINKEIFDMIIAYRNSKNNESVKENFNKILAEKMPKILSKKELNNLKYRAEKRGFFDFFLSVYEKTEAESLIIQKWKELMNKNGHVIDIVNTGIDNNGAPKANSNKEFKNADFIIYIDGKKYNLDLKISPTINCFTFKIDDLTRYIKNDILILLIMKDDDRPKLWSIINHDIMDKMINNKLGERFRHFGGFKKTQRIFRKNKGKILGYLELQNKGLLEIHEFN